MSVCKTEPGETEATAVLPHPACRGGTKEEEKGFIEEEEKKEEKEEEEKGFMKKEEEKGFIMKEEKKRGLMVTEEEGEEEEISREEEVAMWNSLLPISTDPTPRPHSQDYSPQVLRGREEDGEREDGEREEEQDEPGVHRMILEQLRVISADVSELQKQVAFTKSLLQSLAGGVGGVADLSLPPDVTLPIRDQAMLQGLEELLASDPHTADQMVPFLAAKGGKTLKEMVRRMLDCAISNDLALKMNWTGAGQKIAFRSLRLKTVIHRATRKNPQTREATEEALQQEISKYLKGASDREGGWKSRKRPRDPLPQ